MGDCKEANDAFEDIERIKKSLSNLRGFVYSSPNIADDIFYCLTRSILRNFTSFKQLESIHIHYPEVNSELELLWNNLSNVTELCISVPFNEPNYPNRML